MMTYMMRFIEEIFPLLAFFLNKNKVMRRLSNDEDVIKLSQPYIDLDVDSLNKRIVEEHERAVKIDEKTSKFTLGLSVSLTVLSAASGVFVKYVPDNKFIDGVSILCGVASVYMLLAGITALGALKTLATYGYGTHHLLHASTKGIPYLSQALYCQEKMNSLRHLRNEAAYQSLRNGFILLLFALVISVVGLIVNQRDTNIEPIKPLEGIYEITPLESESQRSEVLDNKEMEDKSDKNSDNDNLKVESNHQKENDSLNRAENNDLKSNDIDVAEKNKVESSSASSL